MQTNCILVASNFVICPQILTFVVFSIASLSPYWLQMRFSMSPFSYSFTFAINLWHQKFVTADVTAVLVNNQHGIQQWGQDVHTVKSLYLKGYTAEVDRQISWEKPDKTVLISCLKSCRTQAQLTGGQKFEFLISQGSVATCLMWGG